MNEVPRIDWYQSLAKPSWTPAPRTIGGVETVRDSLD
jgi:tryptophan-rich sensory protein